MTYNKDFGYFYYLIKKEQLVIYLYLAILEFYAKLLKLSCSKN